MFWRLLAPQIYNSNLNIAYTRFKELVLIVAKNKFCERTLSILFEKKAELELLQHKFSKLTLYNDPLFAQYVSRSWALLWLQF